MILTIKIMRDIFELFEIGFVDRCHRVIIWRIFGLKGAQWYEQNYYGRVQIKS